MPLVALKKIEVFREGDYGPKGTYAAADLQAIASSYDSSKHHAPVTVDHEKKGPAFGWVESVNFSEGKNHKDKKARLLCDLSLVPEFAEQVKNKLFPKRSVEFYREFSEGVDLYLKRVSFLGAQIPEIKGMPDPEFAEGKSSGFVEFSNPDCASFMEEPPRPADAKFGVISKQSSCREILNHFHMVYTDADGNGYTSQPLHYDDCYCTEVLESDKHQHLVKDGQIQPATSSWGAEHTHNFYGYDFSEADSNPTEEQHMSGKPANPPAPGTEAKKEPSFAESPEFAEMKAKNDLLEKQVTEMKRAESQRKFDAAFSEAVGRGAIAPAAKGRIEALFHALEGNENSVEFSEGDKKLTGKPQELLLDAISNLQRVPEFGENPSTASNKKLTDPKKSEDPAQFSEEEFKRANEYAKKNNVSFAEAAKAVRDGSDK